MHGKSINTLILCRSSVLINAKAHSVSHHPKGLRGSTRSYRASSGLRDSVTDAAGSGPVICLRFKFTLQTGVARAAMQAAWNSASLSFPPPWHPIFSAAFPPKWAPPKWAFELVYASVLPECGYSLPLSSSVLLTCDFSLVKPYWS